MTDRAQRYMWMLPVVFVAGACVFGLGIIAAWIMYVLFLNKIRLDLRDVRLQITRGHGRPPGALPEFTSNL